MVLNATAIPIPSEVTLPFSGFLASRGSLSLILVIVAGILGDLVGSLIGYSIGYFLEENLLLGLIKKFGKFILVTEHDYHKIIGLIKKYGLPFVFVGKMFPGSQIFYGGRRRNHRSQLNKFIIGNVLSALIYVSFVSYIGFYLGSKWKVLGGYFQKFELVIAVCLVLTVILYINYKLNILNSEENNLQEFSN